jgi:uncharacterized protein YidB (DUF937 family)
MLEQLLNLVQQESQDAIINNPSIPNEYNNQAVGLATESVFGGLQNALANGGLQDVLGMFAGQNGPSSSNGLVNGISNNLVKGLMDKFGIDSPVAQSIATSLVPSILGKLVSRTNDPSDNGFDINGIIGSLIGGANGQSGVQLPGASASQGGGIDFGGILKNLTSGGLDSNHDGQLGLEDLTSMIGNAAGNARNQTNNSQVAAVVC